MRFYLAARYSRNHEMREYAQALADLGHEPICRWINGSHDMTRDAQSDDERATFAIEDMEDLSKVDAVLSFSEGASDKEVKRPSKGGRHVEFGLGLALNKRMILIGPQEHVFHWLPEIEVYETLEEFLDTLENEEIN